MRIAMSLYNAVAEGDCSAILNTFISSAKKTADTFSSVGVRSKRTGSIFAEEKCDEFFHNNTTQSNDIPYNLILVELLDLLARNEMTTVEAKQIALMEALAREEEKFAKNGGWLSPRRRKSHKLSFRQQMHEDEEDAMRISAKILSNTRPPTNFVLRSSDLKKNKQKQENLKDDDDHSQSKQLDQAQRLGDDQEHERRPPPLFDGSIGLNTGSLVHLACIVDQPFILAMLLVLGADPKSKHSAFRRLLIHEAACSNSVQCLTFLLELSKAFPDDTFQSGGKYLGSHCFPVLFSNTSKKAQSVYNLFKPCTTARDSKLLAANITPPASSPVSQNSNGIHTYFPFVAKLRLIQNLLGQIQSKKMSPSLAAIELLSQSRYSLSSSFSQILTECDGHGNTALHWGAFKNCPECVSALLSAGANPNASTFTTGWTPLHDAAYSDSTEATRLLIDGGADPNARANSGATPLCFAAQEDSPNAAEILLDAGADPYVFCCGNSQNGDINQQHHNNNNNIFNPVFLGNGNGSLPPPVTLTTTTSRFSGYTPLHYCAHYNAAKAAKVLISHGCPIEIYDLADRLPIHIAVARGSSNVLRELLIAGAKLEVERNPSFSDSSNNFEIGRARSFDSAMLPRRNQNMRVEQQSQQQYQHNDDTSQNLQPLQRQPDIIPPPPPHHSSLISDEQSQNLASSPVLRQMVPREPHTSSKPWNCLSQKSIDECVSLIEAAEGSWSRGTHKLFSPKDRRAVLELLRVGKRLEQEGSGIFLDLWPHVLSFCGRGWFETTDEKRMVEGGGGELDCGIPIVQNLIQKKSRIPFTTKNSSILLNDMNQSDDIDRSTSAVESIEDNNNFVRDLTQFQLDN